MLDKILSFIADKLQSINNSLQTLTNSLNNKQDKLTFDTTPKAGSSNPVTSDGINNSLQTLTNSLNNKQDKLTFKTIDVKSKITLTSNFTLNHAKLFKFGNIGIVEMNLKSTSSFSKDAQFKLFSVSNSWIKAGVVSGSNLSGAINASGNAWVTTQTKLNSGSSIDVVASVALA